MYRVGPAEILERWQIFYSAMKACFRVNRCKHDPAGGGVDSFRMSHAILLVDDDVEFAELLRAYLSRDDFRVTLAHTGIQGVAEALSGQHQLVVLDVMMPGLDGLQALKQIRTFSTVPVLMLTARGDDGDRITGLELGADDYVPKPCTPRELCARIRAILRRTVIASQVARAPVIAGPLTLWPGSRRAEIHGKALGLTHTEFSLLEVLARQCGQLVSKTELSREALDSPAGRFDRRIDVHISRIRQKMGVLADGRECIQTVIRKGYQLILE